MRMIGSLQNSQQAKRLGAYLLTQGIKSQMEQEGAEWEIWIKDEDQLGASKTILDEFLQNPDQEKYQSALAKAESIQREEERKRREYQKNLNVGTQQVANQKKSPMTFVLIAICGIVALMTNFGHPSRRASPTMRALAYTAVGGPHMQKVFEALDEDPQQPSAEAMERSSVRHASLVRGEVWRLITPIFIHFGAFHLVFNMIWLFQLGRLTEHRYGTFYFFALVIFIAATSNFVQCAVPERVGGSLPAFLLGPLMITLFGGMSGVVFGLLGFVWVKSSIDPSSRMFMPQSTVMIMLAYLFFCMTPMAANFGLDNVANWAHGIGLLAGLAAGYLTTVIGK